MHQPAHSAPRRPYWLIQRNVNPLSIPLYCGGLITCSSHLIHSLEPSNANAKDCTMRRFAKHSTDTIGSTGLVIIALLWSLSLFLTCFVVSNAHLTRSTPHQPPVQQQLPYAHTLIPPPPPPPPLPHQLAPRLIKTKYGQLRGILIHFGHELSSGSSSSSAPLSSSSSASSSLLPHHNTHSGSALLAFSTSNPYYWHTANGSSMSGLPTASRFTSRPSHHLNRYSTFASANAHFPGSFTRPLPTMSTPSTGSHSSSTSSPHSPQITVEAFLGIPYAQPPTGNLRFLPPVSPAHWRGVRLADQLAPVCIQQLPLELQTGTAKSHEHNVFADSSKSRSSSSAKPSLEKLAGIYRLSDHLRNQSEDCLHLNLYLPYSHRGTSYKKIARFSQRILITRFLLLNKSKDARIN